jgi:chromosome segregation ATPase
MENSFSLQFNPMTQLKTVQDYENEIARLQNENFEIKHQLSYYKTNPVSSVDDDIQKLLYDSKTSIDILENENKNLHKQIDHMKEIIRSNNSDKEKLIKDFTDQKKDCEGRLANMEEENQRLISHIGNMKNKYESICQEHKMCQEGKNEINNLRNENSNLKNEINNLRNENNLLRGEKNENNLLRGEINNLNNNINLLQNEVNNLKNEKMTFFAEGEKLLNENSQLQSQYKILYEERNNLLNLKNDYERRLKLADEECKNYERKIKSFSCDMEALKESDLYYKELQRNFNKETRDKQKIAIENEDLRNEIEILNKKLEIIQNEKRAMKYKMSKDDGYLYKEICNELSNYKEIIDGITNKVRKMYLTKENEDFLTSINIKNRNFNNIVSLFRNLYSRMKDRIEVLRRELHDMNKFNKNDKVMEVVKKIAEEFKNAKYDLENCKKYLEKKSKEIKEIKREKMGLEKKYENLVKKLGYQCKV